ncbi:hypothetical protein SDC9_169318 [bioreactor metagenome]|uniref:Uncharacterized protein n=1 Tax=bioreactor metagenome TaxID=1076179 RepID=A0A645G705_9ZZZZ
MRVKTGGICCVMTMPGISRGNTLRIWLVASVPPVDAPMATSMLFSPPPVGICSGKGTGAASLFAAEASLRTRRTKRAMEAILIFEASSLEKFSISPASGLAIKSTAPACNASNTIPFAALTTIMGMGCWGMRSFKNSIPFMPGISTSNVITSG